MLKLHYLLAHFLAPLRGERREVELHVTLLPGVFTNTPQEEQALHDLIASELSSTQSFTLIPGEREYFGEPAIFPVVTLESTAAHELHGRLHAGVSALGLQFRNPHFAGAGYRPHATLSLLQEEVVPASITVDALELSTHEGEVGLNMTVSGRWRLSHR